MINISEKNLVERAILVGIITNSQIEEQVIEYLDELAFLAETAGAVTVRRFTQKIDTPNPKTYIGQEHAGNRRFCLSIRGGINELPGIII